MLICRGCDNKLMLTASLLRIFNLWLFQNSCDSKTSVAFTMEVAMSLWKQCSVILCWRTCNSMSVQSSRDLCPMLPEILDWFQLIYYTNGYTCTRYLPLMQNTLAIESFTSEEGTLHWKKVLLLVEEILRAQPMRSQRLVLKRQQLKFRSTVITGWE